MSHSLSHLTTFLPPDFLSGHMDHHKPLFLNPYDLTYSSSTESVSDDDDVTVLTRSFTRSISFQDPLKSSHPLEKRKVFSGSPEPALKRNVFGSAPTTPFCKASEDCLELIYAAAEHVGRLKMKMKMKNDAVTNRASLSQHHYYPKSPMLSENEEFFRRQQLCRRVAASGDHHCGVQCGLGGPVGSAWPPVSLGNLRRQQPINGSTGKPVSGRFSTGGIKKERAGTGVFLPRNYPNILPEPKKKPACSPTHMPAGLPQPNKYMYPIIPQPQQQPNVHNGFTQQLQLPPPAPLTHHFNRGELAALVTARRNAVMLAQQRRSATHAEVVLPQEWTY